MKIPSISITFFGRCPKCAQGKLYQGWVKLNPSCGVCDFDYSRLETDDGAAAFTTLIIGALLAPLIFYLELAHQPSLGAYLLFGLPLVFALSVASIRVVKSVLIFYQYHYLK